MTDPVAQIREWCQEKGLDLAAGTQRTRLPKPPRLDFDPDRTYYWVMKTNHGDLKIRLMPEVAPMHVSATLYLAGLGFYDGLGFHRVIPGFMAQGGCPLGSGTGDPGFRYDGEFDPGVRHDRPGLLSMANAGPGTDGSQFFLTFVPTPHLDGHHTIFGEVVEGQDTLGELEKRGSRPAGRPTESLKILETSIVTE